MKTKIRVVVMVVVSLIVIIGEGAVDYKCMSDCLARGYLYGYCKSVCSY